MNPYSKRLPTLDEVKQELARKNYYDYLQYVHDGLYKPTRHGEFIASILQDAIERRKLMLAGLTPMANQYFIFTMPPRHSKSMTITETLPSYFLGQFPHGRVIEGSYSTTFAQKFGKRNRQKIERYGKVLFDIEISKETSSATDWDLEGYRGGMISRGILAGVTGEGADLMIIDDPIKNREEADSEVYREKLWAEWIDSFSTRLHPGAIVIIIITRWHEDDLVGRLQNPEYGKLLPWKVTNLPLEAEENDPLGRSVGEPLWPEMYGYDFIEQRKMYPASFNSLYQGRPTSQEGNILKREWWRYYDRTPNIMQWVLSVDCNFKDKDSSTAKKKTDTDPACVQVWGKTEANMYLIDNWTGRVNFPTLLQQIRNMLAKYPKVGAKFVEDKANGPAIIAVLNREIGGFIAIPANEGKVARVEAVSPWIESGNVFLPRQAEWVHDFVEECASFPQGKHDDQVDAMSQALNRFIYFSAELPPAPNNPQFEFEKPKPDPFIGAEPDNSYINWS